MSPRSDGGRPEGDKFGISVSISGTTGLIGAPTGGGPDGRAYVCDLAVLSSDEGACRRAIPLVDEQMTLSEVSTSCCDGSTFTITAVFANTGPVSISELFFEVFHLTGGNLVENADEGPGGVGATLTPGSPDRLLLPGESMTMTFRIHLATMNPFQFLVRVRGEPMDE